MQNDEQAVTSQATSADGNMAIDFMARSAGDLHGVYLRELLDELSSLRDDEGLLAKSLVTSLNAHDLVNDDEAKLLGELVDAFLDESPISSSASRIESIHRAIATTRHPSPIALTIAGIGLNAMTTAVREESGVVVVKKEKDAKEKGKKGTAFADLMGGLAGANIGSKGGLLGGIIGGLVGGVGASYLAKKDQEKEDKGGDNA